MRIALLVVAAVVACAPPPEPPLPGEPAGPLTSLFGEGPPSEELQRALGGMKGVRVGDVRCDDGVDDVVDLDGRCDAGHTIANEADFEERGARAVGDVAAYDRTIRFLGAGTVRVRSNAVFPRENLSNVLGNARAGRCHRADGPLKDADVPGGVGYAVRVRDRAGVVCRGYVSASVVDD